MLGMSVKKNFIGICVSDFIISRNEIQHIHAQYSLYETLLRNVYF